MSNSTLNSLQQLLEKARKRLSDEEADYSDRDDDAPDFSEDDGFHEVDPETEGDEADQWLKEAEGKAASKKDAEPAAPKRKQKEAPAVERKQATPVAAKPAPTPTKVEAKPTEPAPKQRIEMPSAGAEKKEGRYPQPTREELNQMREYTRPWEQRARDKSRLEAQPHVNPVKHHEGRIVEARNLSHADRQKAYDAFQASKEYQDADPITQMELDAKFHKDWHEKNPEHLLNAMKAHGEAHKKGERARELHGALLRTTRFVISLPAELSPVHSRLKRECSMRVTSAVKRVKHQVALLKTRRHRSRLVIKSS
jgi:hypothetical protein